MKLITAHELLTGEVVYWTEAGAWSKHIKDAAAFPDEPADAAIATAKKQSTIVTNVYLVEADAPGQPSSRVRLRETIRAQGPTVRRDLGKQAEGAQ
jgi:hypothetical protein